jgi:hypothetical protein
MANPYRELDTVVLTRDLPDGSLRTGDLGAVVQVLGDETVEVEFVTASGQTQVVCVLPVVDLRAVRDDDLLSVRQASTRGAA